MSTDNNPLLDAVDELDRITALIRCLDMALENDASDNEGALRQVLFEIGIRTDTARKRLATRMAESPTAKRSTEELAGLAERERCKRIAYLEAKKHGESDAAAACIEVALAIAEGQHG